MRKVIACINMTIDGFCDHTAVDPDAEIHQHYANLLKEAGVMLLGRITFGLMEYWRTVVANPTGEKATDDFAVTIDRLPKILFSRTVHHTDWATARLSQLGLEQEVGALKAEPGNPILVGSRSLIIQLLKAGLIDELQLCIHPVIAGGGLPLFDGMNHPQFLTLVGTKKFSSGAILAFYRPGTPA